ncbi:MAG: aminofutalosine synthase MqnE [Nitrospirota bacterium]|nr:aminofutalosine synthase MqnE [Nitrospirota bacterium]
MTTVLQTDLTKIAAKVEAGERLSFDDGLALFESDDIFAIGRLAALANQRKNGDRVYFIHNRHINYSNVCKNTCKFCAFSKKEEDTGAYTMTIDEIMDKAREMKGSDFSELHIVGGLHPTLPFEYYTEMLRSLKAEFPEVHIQAFTAVEIAHLAEVSGRSYREALEELVACGLGSLPGGGAEVFAPEVRDVVCPEKLPGNKWLEVMRTAHSLGLKSNATMLYGHLESKADRVRHMIHLRDMQDETGGFQTFIPLAFHPKNTQLSDLHFTTGLDDLKTLAIARLMLDNFDHIKVFWIMTGLKVAQLALLFGVDDIDGTVVEEKITHAAGAETSECLTIDELVRLIREAGKTPVERDTLYNVRKVYVS